LTDIPRAILVDDNLRFPCRRLLAALVIILFSMTMVFSASPFDRLQKAFVQRWGTASLPRFQSWRALMDELPSLPEADRLKRVNEFFNRTTRFEDDWTVWGQEDYWATPIETLGKGAGDCEDFVIAKYFSLRIAGVQPERLKLIYVKAKIGGASSTVSQAHMVLAYYEQPESEPVVLDNLISDIRPASRRPDLVPVFSFNTDGIWVKGSSQPPASVDRLSKWKDLLIRAHAEGFEF
jgi:predicted transglutaminase-like cysteine proteinase